MPIPYYHVDAFTGELFAGNPAGVCMLSAFLADSTMRKIAAENRHSNTAFVVPRADGDFDLRWFTPEVEDDLCGHATLASAYVLTLLKHTAWPVRFHTRSGVLTVTREQDGFELDFPARPPQPCATPVELLPALGLKTAQVMRSRDYLVVVDDAEQVRALSPNIAALAQLDTGIGGAIVTAPGEADVDYVCRFCAPAARIFKRYPDAMNAEARRRARSAMPQAEQIARPTEWGTPTRPVLVFLPSPERDSKTRRHRLDERRGGGHSPSVSTAVARLIRTW